MSVFAAKGWVSARGTGKLVIIKEVMWHRRCPMRRIGSGAIREAELISVRVAAEGRGFSALVARKFISNGMKSLRMFG
jgi:hypothetical protein